MREWQSQTHVRWYCKYHVVIVPKCRKKAVYGVLRKDIGGILRDLCRQFGVELVEGHAMSDHVHMCLGSSKTGHSIPSNELALSASGLNRYRGNGALL